MRQADTNTGVNEEALRASTKRRRIRVRRMTREVGRVGHLRSGVTIRPIVPFVAVVAGPEVLRDLLECDNVVALHAELR